MWLDRKRKRTAKREEKQLAKDAKKDIKFYSRANVDKLTTDDGQFPRSSDHCIERKLSSRNHRNIASMCFSRVNTQGYEELWWISNEYSFITAIFPMISEMSPARDINKNKRRKYKEKVERTKSTFASSNKNMFGIYFTRNNTLFFIHYFHLIILFDLDA